MPKRYGLSSPPNDLRDQRSLQSWHDLFKARQAWALKIAEDCGHMAQSTEDRYGEMDVMMRCLEAAAANLEGVVKAVEAKYADVQRWVGPTQADYGALVSGWEQHLALSRKVPISAALLRFMTGRDAGFSKGKPSRQVTLEDLIDLETARKTGKAAASGLRKFNTRVADLDRSAPRLFQACEELLREFDRTVDRSALTREADPAQLLQDIEAVAQKIETDHQITLEFSDTTRDLLQASKIAASHTERLLPSIRTRALEMDEMLRHATQARNGLAAESVNLMRTITELTSMSTTVRSLVNLVNEEDDVVHFDYLRLIQQIPYVYASFGAEAIKRREWFERVKADSSTLANEMALFQDEEVKRRRKWQKSIANLAYGPESSTVDKRVPGLEVNLLGEQEEWPNVSKKELEAFFEALQRQDADADLIEDVGKLIVELNNPTRQQTKRLKAFKNGSVHEAALGRSGLLIRGDDDLLRSLQDDKTKLESKLRTAESRVRRLEDLLHRQSQASRPTLGNIFQPPGQAFTDRNDSTSSVKSPRSSDGRRRSSEGAEMRLLQRIQQLEAELGAEKERSALFEKNLTARMSQNQDMKGQMDEVNSTKRDLLENMEALKREFMGERKSLEDEIRRLQARLEDTEDEMEHFGESRENEKASYDEKLRALQQELEAAGEEHRDDVQKAHGQVEFLRKESKLQRERNDAIEKQLQAAQEDAKALSKRLQSAGEAGETQLKALKEFHAQLLPGERPPDDLNDLIESASGRLADLLSRLQDLEGDVSLLKTDHGLAQATIKDLRAEIAQAAERVATGEMASLRLKEKLSEEKARVAALEEELSQGYEQLNQLRVTIADGETGSETLRKKLEEEERKIMRLTEELATKQSQVGSVEEELRLFQEKSRESLADLAVVKDRLANRTERAKDLSQRLYTQNDRLCRLLERLGFSVSREGESMTIQKVPRSERSTQLLNDQNDGAAGVRRSGMLTGRALGDSTDLELLYWMNSADSETESERYAAYMSALGSFDIDAFAETVYRRVKDVEHIARKLQRDVRGYREKAHSLQKEAHEKIAFKHFKEGDLALFLPTRNQTSGAWAAFNIGFPHYFLREQEAHRLRNREWLVARISRIQEKVVDLSKSLQGQGDAESLNDEENDNPFDLSDGLRWYMIEAQEDKPGAPSTPGLGKSTVAANNVEAMADMRTHTPASGKGLGLGGRPTGIDGVSKTLSKSLESRRSSTSSRKALPFAIGAGGRNNALAGETNSRAAAAETPVATSPALPQDQIQSPRPAADPQSDPKRPQQQQQQQQATEVRGERGETIEP